MQFYVGLHQPHQAGEFETSFISINRIRNRKSPFSVKRWIMDSGAFTEVSRHGGYRSSVEKYAREINQWKNNGQLLAAVAQDYMCEPFVLARTGLTVIEHQMMTISRYVKLKALTDVYIMPVLQGFKPEEYAAHIRMYGDLLPLGAWVGVGSICKRNADPRAILAVFEAIHAERPDLRLHGFGLKLTALASPAIRAHLHTRQILWRGVQRHAMRRTCVAEGKGQTALMRQESFMTVSATSF